MYEFFLEFCICCFLQLSVQDLNQFSPSFQFFTSVSLLLGILAAVGFVVMLFYCGGPWISGFFIPHTALKSAMFDHRTRSPDFDGKKWLKEHPKPAIKPWGGFIITLDFTSIGNFFSCGKKDPYYDPRLDLTRLHDLPEKTPDTPDEKDGEEKKDGEEPPMTERGLLDSENPDGDKHSDGKPKSDFDNESGKHRQTLDETLEGTAGNASAENDANKKQPSVDVDDQEMDSDSDDDIERDP